MRSAKYKHLKFVVIVIAIYVVFVIRGLSTNHYQDLQLDFIFIDNLEIFMWLIPACFIILKFVSRKQDYFKDSFWLTFYATVPFVCFDLIFLGGIKGYGVGYFGRWWFLTLFYFILWVEFPIVGYLMQIDDREVEKKHLLIIAIASSCWLVNFWEGKSSSHFQQWTLDMKLMRLSNIPLILLLITWLFLRHFSHRKSYLKDGCLMALYFMFVFLLCDLHYLAVYKKFGIYYWVDNWFVALFYPLFWIVIPATAWAMKHMSLTSDNVSCSNSTSI